MKNRAWIIIIIFILLASMFLPNGILPVRAQGSSQVIRPQSICNPGEPCQGDDALWHMSTDNLAEQLMPERPSSIGGPDEYGYTWNDAVPFIWEDAVETNNVGFSGYITELSAPITLPFSFPYYENTYTQVYVSPMGYLTFADQWVDPQSEIPYPGEPNNIIAPYWTNLEYSLNSINGKAYYLFGGSAPNRYLLVEWYRVMDGANRYTFEVMLYENGNFTFQYQQMQYLDYTYTCAAEGMEDRDGIVGLAYLNFCDPMPTNKAVRFYRPAPAARVKADSLYHGSLVHSGEVNDYTFSVINTGELGSDTYELSITSTWALEIFQQDGSTPFSDTNGNGSVDTGPINQGDSRKVIARITAPGGLAMGVENLAWVTVTSTRNPTKSQQVQIESTVPAPFVQAYQDQATGIMSLDQNWPVHQESINAAPDWSPDYGYEPVVIEIPNHNLLYAWKRPVDTGDHYGYIIQYTVIDKYGEVVTPVTDLTELNDTVEFTYVGSPALSVNRAGLVGITWNSYLQQYSGSEYVYNYNIWVAFVRPDGSLRYGATNLTNNTDWANSNDVIRMLQPSIEVNYSEIAIVWPQAQYINGLFSSAIYSTSIWFESSGVKWYKYLVAKSIAGRIINRYPALIRLKYDDILLVMHRINTYDGKSGIFYGQGYRHEITYWRDSGITGQQIDGVRLSGDNIFIAATDGKKINYTILDKDTLNPIGTFESLSHPSAHTSDLNLSVTADGNNHAILTWGDAGRKYTYYALVDGNGTLLNGPAISRTALPGSFLEINDYGGAITTNKWDVPNSVDTALQLAASYGAAPGGTAVIGIPYANNGFVNASSLRINVTLTAGLTYLGASSPNCVMGSVLICSMPDLAFGDSGALQIYLGLPETAPIGNTWVMQAVIGSSSVDANPADNSAEATIFAGRQVFLPSVCK